MSYIIDKEANIFFLGRRCVFARPAHDDHFYGRAIDVRAGLRRVCQIGKCEQERSALATHALVSPNDLNRSGDNSVKRHPQCRDT